MIDFINKIEKIKALTHEEQVLLTRLSEVLKEKEQLLKKAKG